MVSGGREIFNKVGGRIPQGARKGKPAGSRTGNARGGAGREMEGIGEGKLASEMGEFCKGEGEIGWTVEWESGIRVTELERASS